MYNKIIRGFNQSLSAEEQAQVELWKSESNENLKVINELKAIHNASNDLKDYKAFDKEKAWNNITSKTGIVDESPTAKQFTLPTWAKSLAAIFTLGIIAFFLLKSQVTSPDLYQTFTTADEIQTVDLADGTAVVLDKNSSLKVIDERYVNLEGRANFNVTTTSDKDNFTVKLKGGKVTVLGTKFTILSTDDLLEVSVSEGHVKLDYEGRSVDLYANDVVKMSTNQLAVTKNTYENTDSWVINELVFKDEPIHRVLQDLSNHFKQSILLDKSIKNTEACLLTSKYSNPTLEAVLQELKTIFKAEIIKKENSYVITSINC